MVRRFVLLVCAAALAAAGCGSSGSGADTEATTTTKGPTTAVAVETTSSTTTTTPTANTSAGTTTTAPGLAAYSPLAAEIGTRLSTADLVGALCPLAEPPTGIPGAGGYVAADNRHPAVLLDARPDRSPSTDPAEALALGDALRDSPLIDRYSVPPGLLAPTLNDLQIILCITGSDGAGTFIQDCTYADNNTVKWYVGVSSVVAFDAANGTPLAFALASSSDGGFPCNLVAAFSGKNETKERVRSSEDAVGRAIEALIQPGAQLPEDVTIEWLAP